MPLTGTDDVFGTRTAGETITLPSSEGTLAGPYAFTHTYTTGVGLPYRDTYPASPAGGALPAETVTNGYVQASGLDVFTGLSSAIGSYQLNTTVDAYGQVTEAQLGGNSAMACINNKYDPHTGRLTDSQLGNSTLCGNAIDETTYTYDSVGNPTAQTETRQGATAETQCYRYDQLDRLTQAWTATDQCAATPTGTSHTTVGDAIPNSAYWTSWQYNSDGTRKNETDHSLTGASDTTTNYTYGGTATGCPSAGGSHTLQTATTNGTPTGTYCYDQAGNTTQRNTTATGQQSLTWNDQGQLAAVTTASAGSSYIYNADGALLLQKDPGTTTLYLPGEQLVLNTATNAITGTRFYHLSGGAQAVRTGATTNYNFELSDQHNTSTLTLSNTLTGPVWRQQTPYGAPRGTAPTTWPDNHGFLNKPQDTTTGLTNVGARWYDPTTGTFASLDPLLEPASPQQLNGYSYAAGNPVTGSDPNGLFCDGCGPAYYDNNPSTGGSCSFDANGNSNGQCAGGSGPSSQPPACPWTLTNGVCKNPLGSVTYKKRDDAKHIQGGLYIAGIPVPSPQLMQARGFSGKYADQVSEWAGNMCAGGTSSSGLGQYAAFCAAADQLGLIPQVPITDLDPFGVIDSIDCIANGHNCGKALLDLGLDAASLGAGKLLKAGLGTDLEAAAAAQGESVNPGLQDLLGACANSFTGPTPVLMADGTSKPIDQIKIGDKIANNLPGADPATKDKTHTVTAIHITYTDHDYTDVTIDTGHGPATIAGTAHHPYWDQTTHAWTDANQLHPGDQLQTTDGHTTAVLALRDYTTTTTVTHNLTIDTLHTYYVEAGDTPVLVHNDGNYYPAPSTLPGFPDAVRVKPMSPRTGGGGLRARWQDGKNILEWDYQHGTVEMYNKRGQHIGEFDPLSGVQTKDAVPGRTCVR